MTAHPSPEEKYIGAQVGSFRILRCIGAGGMGTVFLAQHTAVDLRVAIKVLRDLDTAGPKAVARFQLEAKVLSQLDHPSLVKLQDCGRLPDGTLYLQTEFLEGQPLATCLQEHGGRLPPEIVLRWGRQMASALAYVHQQGVLHRDLKPSNLYVVADRETAGGQRIKILDFGIAKLCSTAGSQTNSASTQSGQLLGTPRYMSPEQCEGIADLDDRSDVYSLGLILFELLSGESPYQPEPKETMGWLLAHVQKRPRSLRQVLPDASESLSTLIKQMLDKLTAQRPSMAEVEAQLAAMLEGAAPPKKAVRSREQRPRWTMLALAAVLGTGGFLFLPTLRGWIWQRIGSTQRSSPHTERRLTLAALQADAPRGTAFIPGGRFLLGSSEQDIDAALADCQRYRTDCQRDEYERERPPHVVTVSDFYLDKLEVTNADYAAFLNAPRRPLHVEALRLVYAGDALLLDLHDKASGIRYSDGTFSPRPGQEDKPVVQVSWTGAQAFCRSKGMRLPREAEWELAARSGNREAPYPWSGFSLSLWPWPSTSRRATSGNHLTDLGSPSDGPRCDGVVMSRRAGQFCAGTANAKLSESPVGPQSVGTAAQDISPQGIHDLAGNVREWVEDEFRQQYPDCGPCENPRVEANGDLRSVHRIVRGGSFQQEPTATRSSGRSHWPAESLATGIGFRCASYRELPVPSP